MFEFLEWVHAGLKCRIVAQSMGHLCGYVEVLEGHPFYGKDYSAPIEGIAPNLERERRPDNFMENVALLGGGDSVERYLTTICGLIDVHGGVTYADKMRSAPGQDMTAGWWLGFDCAHLDDTPFNWPEERVKAETERMAEQIAAFKVEVPDA